MTAQYGPRTNGPKHRFIESLNIADSRGLRIPFWWRDDDTVDATPALEILLATAQKYQVPLSLAVVPKPATAALAARLADEPVAVLQHGWEHRNHAPVSEKKAELGDHRPTAAVLNDLRQGFDRLSYLFPAQFLPVLVPPWNRIGENVSEARRKAGLIGLSTLGQAPPGDSHVVNVHLDIFEWHPTLRPAEAYAILAHEAEKRLAGDSAPIGIMSHHLVHDDAAWALLEDLIGTLAQHPAVVWPETPKLFGLPSSLSQRIA